jgi:hypothetical protein
LKSLSLTDKTSKMIKRIRSRIKRHTHLSPPPSLLFLHKYPDVRALIAFAIRFTQSMPWCVLYCPFFAFFTNKLLWSSMCPKILFCDKVTNSGPGRGLYPFRDLVPGASPAPVPLPVFASLAGYQRVTPVLIHCSPLQRLSLPPPNPMVTPSQHIYSSLKLELAVPTLPFSLSVSGSLAPNSECPQFCSLCSPL